MTRSDFDIWVKGAYARLLYDLPAPKPVRVAAYQALSGMSGVERAKQGGSTVKLTYTYRGRTSTPGTA
ncbi:hypothetical protein HTZ77_13295 [Nonomuraea sp. SMC257]|uniref:Uncharacterized protein n=1 Tax=Nonomuraea montanisoli TaxID=2741721 RepID=A0A7Y6I643_9ACTN|nr:hypothetical protein [Nonomuraea montanisoli]NUW32398.1 hypothetical protein [Nonomuraea montanisoli]